MIQTSKLGTEHNAITQGSEMIAFHRDCKTTLVKVLTPNPSFVAAVREGSPTSTILGRELGDLPNPVLYPVEAAKARFEQIRHRNDYHLIEWWEGHNEPPTKDRQAFVAMATFDYHLARLLHDVGKKYVALSWGEGHPPMYWDDESEEGKAHPWQFFVDTYAKVFQTADACGVHGYGAPRMFSSGMEDWHLLRFRFWHDRLPPELKPDIWITELGVDGGAIGASGGFRVWITAEEYITDLIRCDLLLQALPYVKKTAIYLWGTIDPQWDSFDLSGSPIRVLREYLISTLRPSEESEEEPKEEEKEMQLPDWITDVRNQVNYDIGLRRTSAIGVMVHHDGIICPWQNSLAYLKRGTDAGSYGWGITPEGWTYYLNSLEDVVWHARDGYNGKWNRGGIPVLFFGYYMEEKRPTDAQSASFRRLRKWLLSLNTFPVGQEIIPHKNVAATACPGDWWPKNAPAPRELLEDEPAEVEKLREEIRILETRVGNLATSMETIRAETKRWA